MSEGQAVAVETATQAAGAETASPPAVDYNTQSDEAILGMPEGSEGQPVNDFGVMAPRPKPQPEAGQPAEAQDEEAKPEAGKRQEPEPEQLPQDGRAIPAELREVFRAHPKLRDAWFSERAYREAFPTVRAAREMAEFFPGGLEQAKQYAEAAQSVARLDAALLSEDFEAKADLVGSIYAQQPGAMTDLLIAGANKLWAENSDAFAEIVGHYARELGLLGGRGEDEGLDELLPHDPHEERARQLDAREQELEARADQARQAAMAEAEGRLVDAVAGPYLGAIEERVTSALPEAPNEIKAEIAGRVMNSINAQLAANPVFGAGFERAKLAGPAEAQKFLMSYVRQMVAPATARVVSDQTARFLSWQKSHFARKKAAGEKREPAGGAPERPQGGTRPPGLDYSRMSDRDILDQG